MSAANTRWSLIDAVRQGDTSAQEEFVTRYRPVVLRALQRSGLREEAEDVAQDVFVRLLAKGALKRARREGGSFRAYLAVLTKRALQDHWTKARAQKRGAGRVAPLDHDPPEEAIADHLDREWLTHLLELALGRLQAEHPNYFASVRGFLCEGRSQGELASAQGRSPKAIRNQVHRGRQKLIAYLREEIARYEPQPSLHQTEVETLARLLELESARKT